MINPEATMYELALPAMLPVIFSCPFALADFESPLYPVFLYKAQVLSAPSAAAALIGNLKELPSLALAAEAAELPMTSKTFCG